MNDSTRQISTARKLLYSSLCLVMFLLLLEAVVRARAWVRYGTSDTQGIVSLFHFDSELQMLVPRAGASMQGSNVDITVNSLGFRGEEFSKEKPPRTVRIACLGASTTFCMEASSNKTTWPHQLQEKLQQHYPDVTIQVINSGITGSAIANSVKDLKQRILPLDPDLVIVYRANNDIVRDVGHAAREAGLIPSNNRKSQSFLSVLSRYSLLAHQIRTNLNLFEGKREGASEDRASKLDHLPKNLPARFVSQLGETHAICKSHGVPLVLSTYLTKFRRSQDVETQRAYADLAFYHMPHLTMDQLLDVFDSYNDALVRFARDHDVPVIIDRDSIPGDDEHYADYMHMTDKGCEKMATRFADFLIGNELIPSRPEDIE